MAYTTSTPGEKIKQEKRNFTARGQSTQDQVNSRWWELPKGERHQGITAVTNHILQQTSLRRRMSFYFQSMYNDSAAQAVSSQVSSLYYQNASVSSNAFFSTSMVLNVFQNCVDTACALISKNKPKTQFLTDGSKDYATKVRGKELTKYIAGLYDKLKIYSKSQRAFRDGCISGNGYLKLSILDDEIYAEHLFTEEVLVDDIDGLHGEPRSMHQRKFVSIDVLAAMFPEHADEIQHTQSSPTASNAHSSVRVIPVRESWHLKSGKKAKDGLRVISIDGLDLLAEPYNKNYFPILSFSWDFNTIGFAGRGIGHEIYKIQKAIDRIIQTIQQSQRLVSGPIIAVEAGSGITEDHITSNRLGKIVKFANTPPQFLTPPAVNEELYQHLSFLIDQAYKLIGISEAMATGNKPAEVKSAVAIRETTDLAAGRFELVGQRWEELHMQIADVLVDLSADLQKQNPDLAIMIAERGKARRLNFKDVKMDIDDYTLQLFPVSGLPSTPAGRLDLLAEYEAKGYVSKEQVMDIVDFPDLDDAISLETAGLHLTQEILSEIKMHGTYIAPLPFVNLQSAFRMSCLEVARAKLQRVDEANIELLIKWSNACQDLINEQTRQQQAMQPQMQPNQGTPSAQGSAMVGANMIQQGQQAPQQPQEPQAPPQ